MCSMTVNEKMEKNFNKITEFDAKKDASKLL